MPLLTLSSIKTAEAEISKNDVIMGQLILRNCPLTLKDSHTPFEHIATSIINQQLSQKAAATIENRILAITPMQSDLILKIKDDTLRNAGMSWRKIGYLKTLATADIDGHLDIALLKKMDNETVICHLCKLKGIGRWTAEMFLMFALRRSDVVALDDAGLQRAAKIHYDKDTTDSKALLEKIAIHWQPWQTVACWYLWRSLE